MESLQSSDAHVDDSGYPSPIRNLPNEVLGHIFVLCACDYPVHLFNTSKHEVPTQVTISLVCVRWHQVALGTNALWSDVIISKLDPNYAGRVSLYRTWVGRSGNYPLTISLFFSDSGIDVYKVFLDFIIPFRIKTLNVTLPYDKLLNLPSLDVEEFAIMLINLQGEVKELPFMDRIRSIYVWGTSAALNWGPSIKKLCLLSHRLRSFECHSHVVSLSTWLDILRASSLQSLESCRLTVSNAGSGPLVGVSMPNLRLLALTLLDVHPDSAIPLISAPNIITLSIISPKNWASGTYDIIAKHYKLHRLVRVWFHAARFPLRIAQLLADAPMMCHLKVFGRPILDAGAQADIASGRLGRHLISLHIHGCFDSAGEWLDMIETRKRNVKLLAAQVSSWRQMFTGITLVEFWNVYNKGAYEEKEAALAALGVDVRLYWEHGTGQAPNTSNRTG